MQCTFEPMTQQTAMLIADTWKYPGVYAFYDMTADPEDYTEITTPSFRRAACSPFALFSPRRRSRG